MGGIYYVKNISKISRKICKIYEYSMCSNRYVSSTKDACIFNKKRLIKRNNNYFHIMKYKNKNTQDGISMKLLVLAFYAQFRVSAGRLVCGLPVTAYGS